MPGSTARLTWSADTPTEPSLRRTRTNMFALPNAFAPAGKRQGLRKLVPWLNRKDRMAEKSEDRRRSYLTNTDDERPPLASKVERSLGDTVTSVAISRDCLVFAAASTNKQANLYSTEDGALVAKFTAAAGVNAILCLGSGSDIVVVVGTFAGNVRFYSVLQEQEVLAVQFATGGAVNCMACAMNDTRLCVGGQSGTIAVYEVNMQSGSGDEQQGDEQPPKGADAGGGDESAPATAIFVRELLTFRCSGPVLSAAMPESGAFIVAGGESKVLELWSLASVHTPHHRHQGGGGGAYGGGNALVGDPGAISSAGGGEADVSAAAGGTIAAEALAAAAPSEAPSEASALGMAPEAGLAAHLSTRFRCMTTIHSVAPNLGPRLE